MRKTVMLVVLALCVVTVGIIIGFYAKHDNHSNPPMMFPGVCTCGDKCHCGELTFQRLKVRYDAKEERFTFTIHEDK